MRRAGGPHGEVLGVVRGLHSPLAVHDPVRHPRDMSKAAERVFEAAMALPSKERAHLSALLADSIEQGEPDAVQAAWDREIDRRLAAFRSGHAEAYSVEDVEREAEALIAGLDAPNVAAAG
jgi:putative addiction module component (TIGR02574 family)